METLCSGERNRKKALPTQLGDVTWQHNLVLVGRKENRLRRLEGGFYSFTLFGRM